MGAPGPEVQTIRQHIPVKECPKEGPKRYFLYAGSYLHITAECH